MRFVVILLVSSTFAHSAFDSKNVKDFGAKGDVVTGADGAISAGSASFTSRSTTFSNKDVGKALIIRGAGVDGVTLFTTILARNSATSVTLEHPALTGVMRAPYW